MGNFENKPNFTRIDGKPIYVDAGGREFEPPEQRPHQPEPRPYRLPEPPFNHPTIRPISKEESDRAADEWEAIRERQEETKRILKIHDDPHTHLDPYEPPPPPPEVPYEPWLP